MTPCALEADTRLPRTDAERGRCGCDLCRRELAGHRVLDRQARRQMAADAGFDTLEDYRGER